MAASARSAWGITHTVTVVYAALSATSIVLDGAISIFSDGAVAGNVTFRVGGQEFDLPNNRTIALDGFDPSTFEVKGDVDYRVTVVGTVRQTGR